MRIALAIAVLFSGLISAFAADLPIKAPPGPMPAYDWSGSYTGLNAGFSDAFNSGAHYDQPYGSPFVPISPSGLLIGGQAGYNWQSGITVFGIETDIQYRNASDSSQFLFPRDSGVIGQPFGSVEHDTTRFSTNKKWFGTLRGRIGLTTGPVLYYATGGLAYGSVRHFYGEGVNSGGDLQRSVSASSTKLGWTVGTGAEMKLRGNWSAGMEYLYVDLGKTTLSMPEQSAVATPFGPFPFPASRASFDNASHIFRFKLNYALNGMN